MKLSLIYIGIFIVGGLCVLKACGLLYLLYIGSDRATTVIVGKQSVYVVGLGAACVWLWKYALKIKHHHHTTDTEND